MTKFFIEDVIEYTAHEYELDSEKMIKIAMKVLTKRMPKRYKTEGLIVKHCFTRAKAEKDRWANIVGISAEMHENHQVKTKTLKKWQFWYKLQYLLAIIPEEKIYTLKN